MEVKQADNGKEGKFFVEKDGMILARMTYHWNGEDRIVIEHTVVDDVLKGKGIGKQLVSKAVDFARDRGIKIVPLCTFAISIFNKVESFRGVL